MSKNLICSLVSFGTILLTCHVADGQSACCRPATGDCIATDLSTCLAHGGVFHDGLLCSAEPCGTGQTIAPNAVSFQPPTVARAAPQFQQASVNPDRHRAAFISGRAPIDAIVDAATDRGAAAPLGGVADVGDPCTCDLDCSDGNVCTEDTCDPVTFLCVQAMAASGTLCGGAEFCDQDTCDGVGTCLPGGGGGDPCSPVEVCNPVTDHCDSCITAADCTGSTDPIFCLTGDCVDGSCHSVSDCTDDEYCDTDGVTSGTCTLDTNVRCCADVEACAATTVAACDDGGGPGSGNYAHQMPFDDCTCPKYSSGINDNPGAALIWELSATEQPCALFNRMGDDYVVANGSYLLMTAWRFYGGIDTDGTGDGTVVFEFYDDSTPPIMVFDTTVGFDPATDRGNNLWQITLATPSIIPPVGYYVMRPGTGSAETVNLLSANAVGMAGSNNPDLMWANDGPRAFLSPDDPDIMAFEFIGSKVAAPLGGCCDPTGAVPCADTTQWVCDDMGFNWVEGVLCVGDPCGSGACCTGAVCTITDAGTCAAGGGTHSGPGTSCDPNCCEQTSTGADFCDGANVLQITVPPIGSPAVTVTISGDASNATDGTCGDGAGGGSGTPCRTNGAAGWTCTVPGETCEPNGECIDYSNDPLWWESFHIDAGANVTIDYCCTTEGAGAGGTKGVHYVLLNDGCDPATSSCGDSTFRSADGGACGDGNPSDVWNELPAGTWYIPIHADNYCSGNRDNCAIDAQCPAGETCVSGATPYQMHITVEPLPLGGCCTMVDGVTQGHCVGGVNAGQACPPSACIAGMCVMEVAPACTPFMDVPSCDAIGGIAIGNTTCTGAPCDLGACCLDGGVCQDNDSVGMPYMDCDLIGGAYFGGVRCIADDPCPICAIEDAAHCQIHDGGFIVQSDRMLGVRWADDFKPATTGPINRVCWWPCFYNPGAGTECSAPSEKPPDDFIIRFYADAGGIPGPEIGMPGGEQLTPDATEPIANSRCWKYSAPVTTPPVVNAGDCYWIEITGLGDSVGGCTVYWSNNNSTGNSYAMNDTDGDYTGNDLRTSIGDEASDMSFCVESGVIAGGCNHAAACCLPDLSCQDNMAFPDCEAASGIFVPGELCGPDTCPSPCDNDACVESFDLNAGACADGLPCTFITDNRFCDVGTNQTLCSAAPNDPPAPTAFGRDHWWTWNSGVVSGEVTASMCDGPQYDGIIAIYDGGADCSACPTDEGTPLMCGDDTCGIGGGLPEVTWQAAPNSCYFIRVGGWNDSTGRSEVTLTAHNGACCYPDGTCGDYVLDTDCVAAGGTFRGAGTTCTVTIRIVDHVSPTWSHVFVTVSICTRSAIAGTSPCVDAPMMIDPWITTEELGANCEDFGHPEACPIPAGFFGEGSDPFTGLACFEGEPLGPVTIPGIAGALDFGDADTLVRRTSDPFEPCDPPSPAEVTVDILVERLNLIGRDPITVTYNGGQNPELWTARVEVSDSTGQPAGSTVTATKEHCNGGTFDSVLAVCPRFVFTRVEAPFTTMVLDYCSVCDPGGIVMSTTDMPWVTRTGSVIDAPNPVCSDFYPGIEAIDPVAACEDPCGDGCCGEGETEANCPDDCAPSSPAPARPLPDARFGIDEFGLDTFRLCNTTSDCLTGLNPNSEVDCILAPTRGGAGTCYVRENNYVSVDPNPVNAVAPTARRVSLELGGGLTHVLGWMSDPEVKNVSGPEPTPQMLSRVVDGPIYLAWLPLGSIHLGDCEISPRHTYLIESIALGSDINDAASYSEPLTLSTVTYYGDVTGGSVRQPPDKNRNFKDINAVVRGFQGNQKEPKCWLDLVGSLATPEVPDFTDINFTDINAAVSGFQGGAYPYPAPCDCPGQACP